MDVILNKKQHMVRFKWLEILHLLKLFSLNDKYEKGVILISQIVSCILEIKREYNIGTWEI